MLSLAIFGGTFDPIHRGHLEISLAIETHFHFDRYFFLPCKTPTQKPAPQASTAQRIEMLQLALKAYPQFKLDLREVQRDSPSYMVDTLKSYRTEYPHAALNLILGYDSFLTLPQWHQWEELITLAHLLVINRVQDQKQQPSKAIKDLVLKHQTQNESTLLEQEAGSLYFFDAGNYPLSSTEIRAQLKKSTLLPQQLPEAVQKYITQWGLYQ